MKLYMNFTVQKGTNSRYPYSATVTNAEELKQVTQWDHVAAQYHDGHRGTERFISADCIMLDIDNAPGKGQPDTPPEQWRDLDAIRADLPGVSFYAVTSRSHMKAKDGRPPRPKYHLYFEIPRTTSAEEYRQIKLDISNRLPYFDQNATDAARMFYGNPEAQVFYIPGDRLITDWIKSTPAPEKPPQAPAAVDLKPRDTRPQRTGVDNGLYNMREVLDAIPCSATTRDEWIRCGMAMKSLGYDVSVWDEWSAQDGARYKPGECARKWQGFKRDGVGGNYLINLAKEHGWTPPERQQKEVKHMDNTIYTVHTVQQATTAQPAQEPEPKEATEAPAGSPSYLDLILQDFQSKRYEPIPTGVPAFDSVINAGFIRQTLVNLSAEPGAGKTLLATQICEHIAEQGRADCLYFNLEMSRAQLLARSLSRATGYSSSTIMRGYQWNTEQRERILTAAEDYKKHIAPHMLYEDQHSSDYQQILLRMDAAYKNRKDMDLPFFVVIDYLQLLTSTEQREDGVEIIKHALKAFKDFATRTGAIVFIIMAQSRAVNESGAVTMGAGRDTSATEYSADLQLMLTYAKIADGTYSTKADMRKALKKGDLKKEAFSDIALVCTKNRFGPPDSVCGMRMEPLRSRFVFDEMRPQDLPQKRVRI